MIDKNFFGGQIALMEEFDDLSHLTVDQKINLLKNGDPEDLLAKKFNLDGLTTHNLCSYTIPLPILLAFPDRIDDLYYNIKGKELLLLVTKIYEGDISLSKKTIQKVVVATIRKNGLSKFDDKIINLDKLDKFLDEITAKDMLMVIITQNPKGKINLIEYLVENYISESYLPTLLSEAICKCHIKLVKYLLEKTDNFDENIYEFYYLNINIVDLLYEKIKDPLKLTRYLIKAFACLMQNDSISHDPLSVNLLYEKFLDYYTFSKIAEIMRSA